MRGVLLGGALIIVVAFMLWACRAHQEAEPSATTLPPLAADGAPAAPDAGGGPVDAAALREDERAYQRMIELVHAGRITPARDEAVRFFARFPESPLGPAVSRLTGVHPRPRLGPARSE